ncbi:hypothetical protein DFH94DRAFT_220515 [Russula ochroleuca]|uniref:Secreted protein n=1 Tax=Russula ochroleuca TaxID=152965 RepID=A0A9P5JXZ7_9AGAM|nr:hypothetical protein DFH94DRAFT_220515 [Russula ochroleuca]
MKVGSASFVSGATLYFVLASPFHLGGPLHLQEPKFATTSARQHRERGMVGAFTPFYGREESLLMQGICATYRACPARARWGQNDRSVTHPTEYTLGGTPAIGTCPGRHSAARCHATACRVVDSSNRGNAGIDLKLAIKIRSKRASVEVHTRAAVRCFFNPMETPKCASASLADSNADSDGPYFLPTAFIRHPPGLQALIH